MANGTASGATGAAETTGTTEEHGMLIALARVVSIAEATSFLLLLVATAVKYGADQPAGVKVLGPLHGGLFIAYCVLVTAVAVARRWPPVRTLLALGASVLPVAPFVVERAWLRGRPPAAGQPPRPASTTA